jgi:hypothetical protein
MKVKKEKPELNALGQTFGEAIDAMKTPTGLEAIKISELIDVSSWKEKQNKLVAENKFFKITDAKTYEAGKKHRTNVVKGRTELQNQEKLIASNFAAIRKEVGNETSTLIEITQPLEDEWQAEVKAWEDRKEREKKEAAEAEAKREKEIRNKIDAFETDSYTIIQKMTFESIIPDQNELANLRDDEFDFAEFEILYDQVHDRVTSAYETKVESLTTAENQRLRNLELEKENAEAKRKSDLQAKRLEEIMPYVAFGQAIDLTKLSEMKDDEYAGHLSSKKGLFEADVKIKQEAEDARFEKEAEEKEAIFNIRKNRLSEIGMTYNESGWFSDENSDAMVNYSSVYESDAISFEESISAAKDTIQFWKNKRKVILEREKLLSDIGMQIQDFGVNFKVGENDYFTVEKYQIENSSQEQFYEILKSAKDAFFRYRSQFIEMFGYKLNEESGMFEMEGFLPYPKDMMLLSTTDFDYWLSTVKTQVDDVNEKLAEADAAKLKAENKARIKKFSMDKKILKEFVSGLEFRHSVPDLENKESDEVLNTLIIALEDFKKEWLNNVEII